MQYASLAPPSGQKLPPGGALQHVLVHFCLISGQWSLRFGLTLPSKGSYAGGPKGPKGPQHSSPILAPPSGHKLPPGGALQHVLVCFCLISGQRSLRLVERSPAKAAMLGARRAPSIAALPKRQLVAKNCNHLVALKHATRFVCDTYIWHNQSLEDWSNGPQQRLLCWGIEGPTCIARPSSANKILVTTTRGPGGPKCPNLTFIPGEGHKRVGGPYSKHRGLVVIYFPARPANIFK